MKMSKYSAPCACGHDHTAHGHYRSGSECALCGCPGWRPVLGCATFSFRRGTSMQVTTEHKADRPAVRGRTLAGSRLWRIRPRFLNVYGPSRDLAGGELCGCRPGARLS